MASKRQSRLDSRNCLLFLEAKIIFCWLALIIAFLSQSMISCNRRKSSDSEPNSHSDHLDCSSGLSSDDQFIIVRGPRKTSGDSDLKRLTQDDRIIIEQLVQANGLMAQIKDIDVLTNPHYFGKYGRIVSSIVHQKQLDPKSKKMNYMAYITYQNDLDAAITLVAMENSSHSHFKYACKYGTSRYCQSFVNDRLCTYKNCPYLHEVKQNTIVLQKSNSTAKYGIETARRKIVNNLSYFLQKQSRQQLQAQKCVIQKGKVRCTCLWVLKSQLNKIIQFPTIKDTLSLLIKQGHIKEEVYQATKNTNNHKKHNYNDKKIIQTEISIPHPTQNDQQVITLQIKQSQQIQQSQYDKNLYPQLPKIKQKDSNLPYILKRYLYPHIKNRQMSPRSQLVEKYLKERESGLVAQQFHRFKKVQMNKKCFNSQIALNSFLRYKITHSLVLKKQSKSLFDFVSLEQNRTVDKIKDKILINLL